MHKDYTMGEIVVKYKNQNYANDTVKASISTAAGESKDSEADGDSVGNGSGKRKRSRYAEDSDSDDGGGPSRQLTAARAIASKLNERHSQNGSGGAKVMTSFSDGARFR